jgi:hypothetical protein
VIQDALIILPGITATSPKRTFLKNYFGNRTSYDVFVPRLWQALGIRGSARQLQFFLRRRVKPLRYGAVHFLSYISGGFILRAMLSRWPLANIGRLVHVRSPLQEQVPGLVIAKHGRLAIALVGGRMLFDLASRWKDDLPCPSTKREQGLILEGGLSKAAANLGVKASDFDALRGSGDFVVPAAGETLLVPESHDDVYTSEALLAHVVRFFESGKF